MTTAQRAEFLAWLSAQDMKELREVKGHVEAVIRFKQAETLRGLTIGQRVVINTEQRGNPHFQPGVVVRVSNGTVLVELDSGMQVRVGPEQIDRSSVPPPTVTGTRPATIKEASLQPVRMGEWTAPAAPSVPRFDEPLGPDSFPGEDFPDADPLADLRQLPPDPA